MSFHREFRTCSHFGSSLIQTGGFCVFSFRSDLAEDFMPARVREGIDVALFTDLQVLTPAAWRDFAAHIESMLAAGRRDSALVLWGVRG